VNQAQGQMGTTSSDGGGRTDANLSPVATLQTQTVQSQTSQPGTQGRFSHQSPFNGRPMSVASGQQAPIRRNPPLQHAQPPQPTQGPPSHSTYPNSASQYTTNRPSDSNVPPARTTRPTRYGAGYNSPPAFQFHDRLPGVEAILRGDDLWPSRR
jgi:hypothetical protein